MKKRYLDLMERALLAYSYEHIERYFSDVKKDSLTEHGFPRLTANIGILIANGRRKDLYDIFIEMMDFCCETIPKVKAANDFSVKEIIFCLLELERAKAVSEDKTESWREQLRSIVPEKCYNVYAKDPSDKVYNWACFSAVSEYMRCYAGLADTYGFIDIQIPTQLQWLDENGMYRDPHEPMVYDLVPRGLFALLLHFGYNGKYKQELDECLRKTGIATLKMQSVTGEIPFGGRSNQFPHNEAHLVIILEYEAKRYKKEGNDKLAAYFKRGARMALDSIELWLSKSPIRHVKNRYDTKTGYGCENYAYFDKYMITVASFLYVGYLICDESIEPADEPYMSVYTHRTSEHFHKSFLCAGDYFCEIEEKADKHYDASGLGRVHKKGAPSVICMSTPCSSSPSYKLGIDQACDLSLCAGTVIDGEERYALDPGSVYKCKDIGSDGTSAYAKYFVSVDGKAELELDYRVSEAGVRCAVFGEGEVLQMIPAFAFDGEKESTIIKNGRVLEIEYEGYKCKYTCSDEIEDTGKEAFNRNGLYKIFAAKGNKSLTLDIEIAPV